MGAWAWLTAQLGMYLREKDAVLAQQIFETILQRCVVRGRE